MLKLFEVVVDPRTDPDLKKVVMNCIAHRTKVRVWYGDTETGTVWPEEWDVLGHIGYSTGTVKVPLLVPIGDDGGPELMAHCILRVVEPRDGNVLYEHPLYHQPEYTMQPCHLEAYDKVYTVEVLLDGEVHARFTSEAEAEQWIAFMKGERFKPCL